MRISYTALTLSYNQAMYQQGHSNKKTDIHKEQFEITIKYILNYSLITLTTLNNDHVLGFDHLTLTFTLMSYLYMFCDLSLDLFSIQEEKTFIVLQSKNILMLN